MVCSTTALSLLATASVAFAIGKPDNPGPKTVPGAYIVEFDEGANVNQFRTQAEPAYETRMEFDYKLFKGISIQLDVSDTAEQRVAQLASLPAVKNIWPVRLYDRPAPVDELPDRNATNSEAVHRGMLHKRQSNSTSPGNAPHVMTQVEKLHARGITGKGITIAVIDTGIDYDHPALGGCFGEGCVVAFGYDLVGDDYTGYNDPIPDDDPDDTCNGHGTHVAGIIAASGETPYSFTGAAPGVTLGAYRVFGCQGTVTDDVLIAAFNRAYEDGADIITSSIGGRNGWSDEPWAAAVSRIVEKGVPCTLAAGNGGDTFFLSSSAADGKGVTAVASFQNTNQPLALDEAFYTIDNGPRISYAWNYAFPTGFDGVERELWATGYDLNNTKDACEPLPEDTPDLSDYYVLIRRSSECRPAQQAANVASKGARFFILYSGREIVQKFDVEFDEGTENILGAALVLQETGESWVRALEAGSTVKTEFNHYSESKDIILIVENTVNGGAPSSFTSWGPTFEMDMKPQFGAPGGNILSTYPLELGGYMVASGTSMATPFVAAAYALLAQARGIKPEPKLFESLFASTAKPRQYHSSEGFQDWLAPAAQQGSGLIQVFDAAYTGSYLEPSSLSFNDTANFLGTLNFTIINDNNAEVTYDITHVPTHSWYALEENEINFPWFGGEDIPEHAELAFGTSKVTIAPSGSISVAVTVTPPEGLNEKRYPYWSGYIIVKGSDGSSLSLPYQGLSGSLYNATMTREDGRTLITDIRSQGEPLAANTTFILPPPGEELDEEAVLTPVFYLNLIWGTRYAFLDAVQLSSANSTLPDHGNRVIGQIFGFTISPPVAYVGWWLGRLESGDYAPAGRYKIVARILRISGDANKDEDWHVIESTPFAIRYKEHSN